MRAAKQGCLLPISLAQQVEEPCEMCQLLGHPHYLHYGGGIGSAAILLDLEHLGHPEQDAIPCLKGFSIQRNVIDKLLQSRRQQLRQ